MIVEERTVDIHMGWVPLALIVIITVLAIVIHFVHTKKRADLKIALNAATNQVEQVQEELNDAKDAHIVDIQKWKFPPASIWIEGRDLNPDLREVSVILFIKKGEITVYPVDEHGDWKSPATQQMA